MKEHAREGKKRARKENPEGRDFGDHLLADLSITQVDIDIAQSDRTLPAFIGKSSMVHPSPHAPSPSPNTQHSTPPVLESKPSNSILHPECDTDVRKKVTEEGWKYIANDKR